MKPIPRATLPSARSARAWGAFFLALPTAVAVAQDNNQGDGREAGAGDARRGPAGVTGASTPGVRAEDGAGQRGADTPGLTGSGAAPRDRSDPRDTTPRSGPVPPSGPALSEPRGGGADRSGERDTAQIVVEPDPAGEMERVRGSRLPGALPNQGTGQELLDPPVGRSGMDTPGGQGAESMAPPGGLVAPQPPEQAAPRDPQTTARMLGEASFVYRDRAMAMAESELNQGEAMGSMIVRQSELLSGEARTQLNDRIIRMNEARTQFSQAISSARAANEPRWEELRRDVVNRYVDYMGAIDEARTAATRGGAQAREPGRLLPAPNVP